MIELVYALILGVVEGITEFLPISSTGHLILAADLLGATEERWKVFNIVIQTGAMLAIVWEYRARFFRIDLLLYRNLIVAVELQVEKPQRTIVARIRDHKRRARPRRPLLFYPFHAVLLALRVERLVAQPPLRLRVIRRPRNRFHIALSSQPKNDLSIAERRLRRNQPSPSHGRNAKREHLVQAPLRRHSGKLAQASVRGWS